MDADTFAKVKPRLDAWVEAGPAVEPDLWPAQKSIPVKLFSYQFATPTSKDCVDIAKRLLPSEYHKYLDELIAGALARRRAGQVKEELLLRQMAEHDRQKCIENESKAHADLLQCEKSQPSVTDKEAHAQHAVKLAEKLRAWEDARLAKTVVDAAAELHYKKLKEEAQKSSLIVIMQWGLQNSWAILSVLLVILINVLIYLYRALEYVTGMSISQRVKKLRRELASVSTRMDALVQGSDATQVQLAAVQEQLARLSQLKEGSPIASSPSHLDAEAVLRALDELKALVAAQKAANAAVKERPSPPQPPSWSLLARYVVAKELQPIVAFLDRGAPELRGEVRVASLLAPRH